MTPRELPDAAMLDRVAHAARIAEGKSRAYLTLAMVFTLLGGGLLGVGICLVLLYGVAVLVDTFNAPLSGLPTPVRITAFACGLALMIGCVASLPVARGASSPRAGREDRRLLNLAEAAAARFRTHPPTAIWLTTSPVVQLVDFAPRAGGFTTRRLVLDAALLASGAEDDLARSIDHAFAHVAGTTRLGAAARCRAVGWCLGDRGEILGHVEPTGVMSLEGFFARVAVAALVVAITTVPSVFFGRALRRAEEDLAAAVAPLAEAFPAVLPTPGADQRRAALGCYLRDVAAPLLAAGLVASNAEEGFEAFLSKGPAPATSVRGHDDLAVMLARAAPPDYAGERPVTKHSWKSLIDREIGETIRSRGKLLTSRLFHAEKTRPTPAGSLRLLLDHLRDGRARAIAEIVDDNIFLAPEGEVQGFIDRCAVIALHDFLAAALVEGGARVADPIEARAYVLALEGELLPPFTLAQEAWTTGDYTALHAIAARVAGPRGPG